MWVSGFCQQPSLGLQDALPIHEMHAPLPSTAPTNQTATHLLATAFEAWSVSSSCI